PPNQAGRFFLFTAFLYHFRKFTIANMFCTSCGKDNPDDAAFCYKCGRQFEDEEETRVAKRSENAPATVSAPVFSISPTIKFVLVGYLIAIIGAFFLVAFLSVFVPAIPPILAVVLGMILL